MITIAHIKLLNGKQHAYLTFTGKDRYVSLEVMRYHLGRDPPRYSVPCTYIHAYWSNCINLREWANQWQAYLGRADRWPNASSRA
jgi:hypothetical protein